MVSSRPPGSPAIEPIANRFTEAAATRLRDAIAEAGGNEVFFVGAVDGERRVVEVEVYCRGKADAAPALLNVARPGEVVIHNHPSGDLIPSDADLAVAGSLGNLGVGFMIVDNPAAQVYVVVEPHRQTGKVTLEAEAVAADLDADGALAHSFVGYEHRQSQVEMARAVARAFDGDGLAMIEAGTGTGKSFAYLFPAARFARGSRKKVVVSTNTINLQTQLLEKDVPQVAAATGDELNAVLLKGRTNYLCRRKLAEARNEPGLLDDPESRRQLEELEAFAKVDAEGSRQRLGFVPAPELWERVQSESDTTLRVKCQHYNECFYYGSRRRAAAADVVLVNHHLLLSDLEVRRELGFGVAALLPPYDRLIVDEAHHLEDAATSHLATRVSMYGLARLLGRLVSAKKSSRGRIPTLAGRLAELTTLVPIEEVRRLVDPLSYHLVPEHTRLVKDLERGFQELRQRLEGSLGRASKGREIRKRVTPDLRDTPVYREELAPRVRALGTRLREYTELLGERLRSLNALPDEALDRLAGTILEVRSIQRRLEERARALADFLEEDLDYCRWVELRRARSGAELGLCLAPVEVGARLKENLFDRLPTVVMTSATLQSGEGFGYLQGRLGLEGDAAERLETLALPSPFDFARQAFVGVPRDLPLPNARGFAEALADLVVEAASLSEGRAFVLFTSYRLLRDVHDLAADRLRVLGMDPLQQGSEDRHRLLERFKGGVAPVLFATSSFWEGVDVPGDALRLVVLTKLPFAVPDEPILQARTERIAARGGDPFQEYSVPQAVLRFRQGFGRLIRTRRDRGAVLVTDRRLIERSYGQAFRAGLPVDELHAAPTEELLAQLKAFFRSEPDE